VVDSGAAESDITNSKREASRAAGQPFDIAANLDHVEQHALQGGTNGELAEWFGQLAVADTQAISAGGKIAADRVHTRVQTRNALDEHAVVDASDAHQSADQKRLG